MFLGDIGSAQNSKTFELYLSVRPSVCPSVHVSFCGKHDCVRTQIATDLKIAHRLILPIRWLVLEMGYIGPQDLVPPI